MLFATRRPFCSGLYVLAVDVNVISGQEITQELGTHQDHVVTHAS